MGCKFYSHKYRSISLWSEKGEKGSPTHSTLSERIAERISDYLVKKVDQDKQAPYTFVKGAEGPPPVLISRMSNTNLFYGISHTSHVIHKVHLIKDSQRAFLACG